MDQIVRKRIAETIGQQQKNASSTKRTFGGNRQEWRTPAKVEAEGKGNQKKRRTNPRDIGYLEGTESSEAKADRRTSRTAEESESGKQKKFNDTGGAKEQRNVGSK